MRKVKALIVPLIIVGLLTIIVLNIKRETNVEGLTLANTNVEPGKVYIEVILWNNNKMTPFITDIWTEFEREYTSMPQTKIRRKDCTEMLDFLNTIPAIKAIIDATNIANPGTIEKDLKKWCSSVMFLYYDESHNSIKREFIGLLSESLLTKDMLLYMFRHAYNKPYKDGKTVSTI